MDFDRFRIDHGAVPCKTRSRQPFFRGPIPLNWLSAAACLPGRTLHVALALRHTAALQKSLTIKVPRRMRETFGISDGLYGLALRRLEGAGLVSVERENGRAPVVTINSLTDTQEGDRQ
jgi:hypothetical protein